MQAADSSVVANQKIGNYRILLANDSSLGLITPFKKAIVLPMRTKVPKEHRITNLSQLVNLRK
jgi:hypothetical protein